MNMLGSSGDVLGSSGSGRAAVVMTSVVESAGSAETVFVHLLELGILFGREDRLVGVVPFGEECFHLFHFLLGQEVIVLVDGFCLVADAFLSCF